MSELSHVENGSIFKIKKKKSIKHLFLSAFFQEYQSIIKNTDMISLRMISLVLDQMTVKLLSFHNNLFLCLCYLKVDRNFCPAHKVSRNLQANEKLIEIWRQPAQGATTRIARYILWYCASDCSVEITSNIPLRSLNQDSLKKKTADQIFCNKC